MQNFICYYFQICEPKYVCMTYQLLYFFINKLFTSLKTKNDLLDKNRSKQFGKKLDFGRRG